ncbi:MAG: YdcF family protein [Atopobiaceae bacterium]|jgi:uncharacterized SAM-binding protein YcdF (DUF218 family)
MYVLIALIPMIICQIWFWVLHIREQRSLWYGLSFIFAAVSTLLALELGLERLFPLESHPAIYQVNIILLSIFIVFLLMFPFVLVITLITSGVRLIRREGASARNMLSLGLGISLIAYVVAWPALRHVLVGLPFLGAILDLLFGFVAILLATASVAFTLYTLSGLLVQVPHPARRYRAIVVLGSGLLPDGSPTPLLKHRVECGIKRWRKNPGAVLVMSGGQGPDELTSESQAMIAYAKSLGVPKTALLSEHESRNTRENIGFSARLLATKGLISAPADDGAGNGVAVPAEHVRRGRSAAAGEREREGGRILVVSDDYHVFRALLICRKLGIAADGAGAHVKLYFSLNALLREWIAYLELRRSFYIKTASVVLAFYLIMAVLQLFWH